MDHDRADLTRLYLHSAEYHAELDPDFYRVPSRAAVVAHYAEVLASPSDEPRVILVAELSGVLIGMIEAQVAGLPASHSMIALQRPATVAMVVTEEHRRTGVGSELIMHAERWAYENGADLIILDMLAANQEARSLYRKLGYVDHGLLLLKRRPNAE